MKLLSTIDNDGNDNSNGLQKGEL